MEGYWIERPNELEYAVQRMEKPDWPAVPAVKLMHQAWLPPCDVSARAQLCHDGERLYVRLEAKERDIRATRSDLLAMVCEDSCLEFFFAPVAADARYLNFEWNPLGTLYLGFGAQRETRVRQLVRDVKALFAPRPFYTRDGWGIEFSVPASFVRLYWPDFAFEGEAAGNFYKCGDRTVCPHYLAWAPLSSEKPDFHRRQDFGRLRFEHDLAWDGEEEREE